MALKSWSNMLVSLISVAAIATTAPEAQATSPPLRGGPINVFGRSVGVGVGVDVGLGLDVGVGVGVGNIPIIGGANVSVLLADLLGIGVNVSAETVLGSGGGGGGGGGGTNQTVCGELVEIRGLTQIGGIVSCSPNATTSSSPLPFLNATVQLRCGGRIVITTRTNATGRFVITLNLFPGLFEFLLRNCQAVVTTSLSVCNPTLPSTGILVSPLRFIGLLIDLDLPVVKLVAKNFNLINVTV